MKAAREPENLMVRWYFTACFMPHDAQGSWTCGVLESLQARHDAVGMQESSGCPQSKSWPRTLTKKTVIGTLGGGMAT
jgi:hypothetical protein